MERFDVLLRDVSTGATIKREWSKAEMLKSVAWLKRMKARGNNIYVRPSGEHGLALLDSLQTENLARMRSQGFPPAISIEVTGNEFQAWVKLSDQALPEQVRHLAETGLARAFSGSGKKMVRDGYGRLAGCAIHNGGPDGSKHEEYVLAHSGKTEIGEQAKAYVEHVKKTLQGVAKEQELKIKGSRISDPSRQNIRAR